MKKSEFLHGGVEKIEIPAIEVPGTIFEHPTPEKLQTYNMRFNFSWTALAATNNPSFVFTSPGGAGTNIKLPFRSMRLSKLRSYMSWTAAVSGARASLSHQIAILQAMAPIETYQPTTQYISDAGNPPTVLPLNYISTLFARDSANSAQEDTPGLMFGSDGFRFTVLPYIPIDVTFFAPTILGALINDNMFFQMDLTFAVIEP